MKVTPEEVQDIGQRLGYDDDAIATVIDRAGNLAEAKRRLQAKLTAQERYVDRKVEERIAAINAEHAQARHVKNQAKARAGRQSKRELMTLPQRLAACFEMAATLPGLSTGSIAGGGSSGKKESTPPPSVSGDTAAFYEIRLRALIGNMERELDAEIHGAAGAAETADERDRRIVRDYEGWLSQEVATFDRSVDATTVENARRKHGRMHVKGYKPPESVVA